eukprot:TRINITY_DN12483_c0_g1_i1.p2 TRINITY_DN12483_c0_g1~~TRINITY_DN12483_c0_g1_i1.p2  ORF type:complete len:689 (+),score=104.63 TRINITY_DN12483_c0_g1_i1:3239-5305(+)
MVRYTSLALMIVAAAGTFTAHVRHQYDLQSQIDTIAANYLSNPQDDLVRIQLQAGVYSIKQSIHFEQFPDNCRIHMIGDPSRPSIISSGINITGFRPSSKFPGVHEAQLPQQAPFFDGKLWQPMRQLYVNGLRYNRTRTDPKALRLDPLTPFFNISSEGYLLSSTVPLSWPSPQSVEFVSDHTWVQHRCTVERVDKLPVAAAAPSCQWTPRVPGASPGPATETKADSWEGCQARCCANSTWCKAIVYHSGEGICYLLPRSYQPNYTPPSINSYVADLSNGSIPSFTTKITMSQPCFQHVQSGRFRMDVPSFIENTGNWSQPGEFWLDRTSGVVYVWFAPTDDVEHAVVTVGQAESLMNVTNRDNVRLEGITFEYTLWNRASTPAGFVERYGTVYTQWQGPYLFPPAAVNVYNSRAVTFSNCTFRNTGAWGLAIGHGSQHVAITACHFVNLSMGSIVIGDVNDTNEADPNRQTAYVTLTDTIIRHMGLEYKGSPGLHVFSLRDSVIAHNLIDDVPYAGLSYNWPLQQGPTLGPNSNSTQLGYGRNNLIAYNRIGRFMSYMNDGGGIHTIGRATNTTLLGNYFYNASCGQPGTHSTWCQSIIYIDNWSCGYQINDNVIDNCPASRHGYAFFQGNKLGPAHDNFVNGLYLRNVPPMLKTDLPCNCTNVVNVTGAWPAQAQQIIAVAGPRAA